MYILIYRASQPIGYKTNLEIQTETRFLASEQLIVKFEGGRTFLLNTDEIVVDRTQSYGINIVEHEIYYKKVLNHIVSSPTV